MQFIKGKELSERYFKEIVADILQTHFPQLKYSAGLLGPGSEVLGFDTERSMDHDWGPRVLIFLHESDLYKQEVLHQAFQRHLPESFLGLPTHFRQVEGETVRVMAERQAEESLNHGITLTTISRFFQEYLAIDPYAEWTSVDWLVMSEQKLRTIRYGNIFHDDLGLASIKKRLSYYPTDIWLYLMLAEWTKIAQEEAFMARCGEAGDELGSRVIAARLIQSIMNLMFLMEREYIPYSKWFGTAFRKLEASERMHPILQQILDAPHWKQRETALSNAYLLLGKQHNDIGITEAIPVLVKDFHDRPYKVIDAERYVSAIRPRIQEKEISQIPWDIGSINQWTHTVDILEEARLMRKLGEVYTTEQ